MLSFTRALAAEPAVLVLDEATSVAHRLSTVQYAGEILVLHHGVLRERGTQEDLLAQGGLYEKLYHLQLGPELAPML